MKAQDYRNMDEAAIQAELDKSRRELLELRCQVALGEEVHPHRLRMLRKEIARMLTVLGERKPAAAAVAADGDQE